MTKSVMNLPQWFLERNDSLNLILSIYNNRINLYDFLEKHCKDSEIKYFVFYKRGVVKVEKELPTLTPDMIFIYDKLKDVYYE
jgi:hypothetical protein